MKTCLKQDVLNTKESGGTDTTSVKLGFHTRALVLMCATCNVTSPTSRSLATHLTNAHGLQAGDASGAAHRLEGIVFEFKRQNTETMFLSEPYEKAPRLKAPGSTCVQSLGPLSGLPVKNGAQCSICYLYHGTFRSLETHLQKAHEVSALNAGNEVTRAASRSVVKIQSLFGGNRTAFFPVHGERVGNVSVVMMCESPRPPSKQNSEKEDAVIEDAPVVETVPAAVKNMFHLMEEQNRKEDEGTPRSVEQSLKNSFMSITHFDDALASLHFSMADGLALASSDMTKYDDEEDFVVSKELVRGICAYFSQLEDVVLDVSTRVLKVVNLRDPDTYFQRCRTETEARYALHVARFLLFAVRAKGLSRLAREANSVPTPASQDSSGFSLRDVASSNAALHASLRGLLLVRKEQSASPSDFMLRNFIVCACVVAVKPEKGCESELPLLRHADAKDISNILAALQYTLGAVALLEVHDLRKRHAENAGIRESRMKELFASVSVTENSAASFLRSTLNIASGILKSEESRPTFDHCNFHINCGIVKRNHLSLAMVGDIVRCAQERFDNVFYERIMLGQPLPDDFSSFAFSLRDEPAKRAPNFSFLTMKGRQLEWVQRNTAYMLHVLQNPGSEKLSLSPCVAAGALDEVSESRCVSVYGIRMLRSRVQNFLSLCQTLQETLLVMLHFSSGSPARATEIRSLRLHNDKHSIRSVFIAQGADLAVNPTYTKSRAIRGFTKAVYRFPDSKSTFRMLAYYSIVRPLECEMVCQMVDVSKEVATHPNAVMSQHWTFLFTDMGEQFSAQRIREIIAAALSTEGLDMGLADYRQFCSGMVPVICRDKLGQSVDEFFQDFTKVAHEQAGHTKNVAEKKYARTSGMLPDINMADLAKYRQFSREWQRLCGLGTTPPEKLFHADQPKLVKNVKSEPKNDRPPLCGGPLGTQSHAVEISGRGILESRVSSQIRDGHGSPYRALASASCLPSMSHVGRSSWSCTSFKVGVQIQDGRLDQFDNVVNLLTGALKKATASEDAEFKSQTQFSVTAFIYTQRINAMVLMPTGAGKTMCIMLPVYMEKRDGLSTIFIVPLRALVTQYMEVSAKFGLVVSNEFVTPGSTEFADVYVFAAEQVHQPGFKELCNLLMTTNRFARVVIDEAHLTAMWESFRMSLKYIQNGLSCVPPSVPRILLSATVPPCERTNILEKHGINDVTLFSMPTLRKNLGFEVALLQGTHSTPQRHRNLDTGFFVAAQSPLVGSSIQLLHDRIVQTFSDSEQAGEYRIMVYTLTRQEVASVKNSIKKMCGGECIASNKHPPFALECSSYHGGMTDDERDRVHKEWTASSNPALSVDGGPVVRVIVCTSAFGTGVDIDNVRLTLHIGGARSLVDFVQECGRAGRDGRSSICLATYSADYEKTVSVAKSNEREGLEASRRRSEMTTWLLDDKTCRKNRLYSFIDGGVAGVCRFDRKTVWCDVCTAYSPGSDAPTRLQLQYSPRTGLPWQQTAVPGSRSNELGTSRSLPSKRTLSSPSSRLFVHGIPGSSRVQGLKRSLTFSSDSSVQDPAPKKVKIPYEARKPASFKIYRAGGTSEGFNRFNVGRRHGQNSLTTPRTFKPLAVHEPGLLAQESGKNDELQPSEFCVVPGINTASGQELAECLKRLLEMGKRFCLLCRAVRKPERKHGANNCPWLASYCLRCFSTSHRVSKCTTSIKVKNACYGCEMKSCKNANLHNYFGPYGRSCSLAFVYPLSFALWSTPALRSAIVQNFFEDDEASQYATTIGSGSEGDLREMFWSALRNRDREVPMGISLVLSWGIIAGYVDL